MSITTSELIQLLQLIILAFTAVVFISQAILRFFLNENIKQIVESIGEEKAMDLMENGVQMIFLSSAFFMFGGSVISLYLVILGSPGPVNRFMEIFESNLLIFGIAILLSIISIALVIQGDYENQNKGIIGFVIATFLTGGISFILIIIYIALWAATKSIDWIFFIGALSVTFALFSLLFGAVIVSEVLVDVVGELLET